LGGNPDDVVWLDRFRLRLEPTTPPDKTPEAMTLMRESIEIAFLTAIQSSHPATRRLILCDVLDWSAKDAADLLDLSVPAVNQRMQRAPGQKLREPSAVSQATVARQRGCRRGRARIC